MQRTAGLLMVWTGVVIGCAGGQKVLTNEQYFMRMFLGSENLERDIFGLVNDYGEWLVVLYDRPAYGRQYDGIDLWNLKTGKREYCAWVNPDSSITLFWPALNYSRRSTVTFDVFIDTLFIQKRFKLK